MRQADWTNDCNTDDPASMTCQISYPLDHDYEEQYTCFLQPNRSDEVYKPLLTFWIEFLHCRTPIEHRTEMQTL